MKKSILLLVFFLCSFSGVNIILLKKIETKAKTLTTDNLGNSYLVDDKELKKYSIDGALIASYSNNNLGQLASVDVSDPLRILLFFKDISKIIFLDNTLSDDGRTVSLFKNEIGQATLACISRSNGIWVYNALNSELIIFNQQLERSKQVANLNQLLNMELNPNFMIEKGNWLYLNNPATGILVFDIFGTYYKTIPLQNLNTFQVFEDQLIYFSNDQIVSYHLKKFEYDTVSIPSPGNTAARIEKDRLFLLKEESFEIYKTQ